MAPPLCTCPQEEAPAVCSYNLSSVRRLRFSWGVPLKRKRHVVMNKWLRIDTTGLWGVVQEKTDLWLGLMIYKMGIIILAWWWPLSLTGRVVGMHSPHFVQCKTGWTAQRNHSRGCRIDKWRNKWKGLNWARHVALRALSIGNNCLVADARHSQYIFRVQQPPQAGDRGRNMFPVSSEVTRAWEHWSSTSHLLRDLSGQTQGSDSPLWKFQSSLSLWRSKEHGEVGGSFSVSGRIWVWISLLPYSCVW